MFARPSVGRARRVCVEHQTAMTANAAQDFWDGSLDSYTWR
jgi:hypothetical protein